MSHSSWPLLRPSPQVGTESPSASLVAVSLCRPAVDPVPRPCPLFVARVEAGFPSPADDYVERALDVSELLIRHPETTFFLRVQGDSMEGAGIHSGDLLVVDRSPEPKGGDVVIAALDGNLTVKRLKKDGDRLHLMPEHPSHEPIEVTKAQELVIWGVVQHVIHEVS